jgi:hypothetical protein
VELASLLDISLGVLSPVHSVLLTLAVAFLQFSAFLVSFSCSLLQNLSVLLFVDFRTVHLNALLDLIVHVFLLAISLVGTLVHLDQIVKLLSLINVALGLFLNLLHKIFNLFLHVLALIVGQDLLSHCFFVLNHAEKSSLIALTYSLSENVQGRLLDSDLVKLNLLGVINDLRSPLVLDRLLFLWHWWVLVKFILDSIA